MWGTNHLPITHNSACFELTYRSLLSGSASLFGFLSSAPGRYRRLLLDVYGI